MTKNYLSVILKSEDKPYTILKEQLINQHSKTDFKKIEALMSLPALGNRKPTELLGEMIELCLKGQEANLFFSWAFTSRLPAWLRVQLAEEDYNQVHRLAVKADRLWAAHGIRQQQAIAAATPLPDDSSDVFAVQSKEAAESWIKKNKQADGPAEMARLESGLCLEHWLRGDKANRKACRRLCS